MFFGSRERSRARRRGVVLILILGMLALMALIGVTFATFAGQQLVNARNFSQSVNFPAYDQVMDWALSQLINDTNITTSGLRGHSVKRDMYGNDSNLTGPGDTIGGLLTALPNGNQLLLTGALGVRSTSTVTPYDYAGLIQYTTNIPVHSGNPQLDGLNFTGWALTILPAIVHQPPNSLNPNSYINVQQVAQSFEVVEDDASGSSSTNHLLTLSPIETPDANTDALASNPNRGPTAAHIGFPRTRIYQDPSSPHLSYLASTIAASTSPIFEKLAVFLTQPPPPVGSGVLVPNDWPYWGNDPRNQSSAIPPVQVPQSNINTPFTLDGRYMRAFNGPGMTAYNAAGLPDANFLGAGQPHNTAAYANFRVNGNLLHYGYQAALGGNPTLPTSGAIGNPDDVGMDEDYDACDLENWFLAIQSADGQVIIPSFHRPGILTAADWKNVATGAGGAADAAAFMSVSKILRPRQVDNSPLFPADPVPDSTGKIKYDLDNDGDGTTDSVWLDLGYPAQRDPRGRSFKPLFAFMVLGLNGRLPLNTVGNLQSRDFQALTGASSPPPFAYEWYPENFLDGPTFSHASHLGYSVNEINPLFALQNAPNSVYGNGSLLYSQADNATNAAGSGGVDVSITQLRNILAGTIPQDNLTTPTFTQNLDRNFVLVNGVKWYMPNGVVDNADVSTNLGVPRLNSAVAGRWGEPNGIPSYLNGLGISRTTTAGYTGGGYAWTNPVRAGKSYVQLSSGIATADGMDDDYDSQDIFPGGFPSTITAAPFGVSAPSPAEGFANTAGASYASPILWSGDFYDQAVSIQLPVERLRRFVTPIDPAGVGRVVDFSGRPINGFDYGNGFDRFGRVSYFRYFRPAGMPQAVNYNVNTLANNPNFVYSDFNTAANVSAVPGNQIYNQPIFTDPVIPDRSNNLYHGWQAAALPIAKGTVGTAQYMESVAVMGAMPYDMVTDPSTKNWTTPTNTMTVTSADPSLATATNPPTNGRLQLSTLYPSTMSVGVNSTTGPFLGQYTYTPNFTGGGYPVIPGYPLHPQDTTNANLQVAVANSYPGFPGVTNSGVLLNYSASALNKDEADEMNLYAPSLWDTPFGPSDIEWLYRKQDIDGVSLNSRLSQLAPISFLNPADGTTRRRLFSTDSWEPISYSFAPDNPFPSNPTSPDFTYNSRFARITNYFPGYTNVAPYSPPGTANTYASPYIPNGSLAGINYNPNPSVYLLPAYQNYQTLGQIPNPVAFGPFFFRSATTTLDKNSTWASGIPTQDPTTHPIYFSVPQPPSFAGVYPTTAPTTVPFALGGVPTAFPLSPIGTGTVPQVNTNNSLPPVLGQSVAHRGRRINLNYPLPVSNDTAEPVRQKWIRETYNLFKAILPPQATDTPQELAQLSQFVVNIIDFRDPDCTATRFVNTDLIVKYSDPTGTYVVSDAAKPILPTLIFADRPLPIDTNTPPHFVVGPYDPTIFDLQEAPYAATTPPSFPYPSRELAWDNVMNVHATPNGTEDRYLVQHGMEYAPLAINEAMAFGWTSKSNGFQSQLYLELVNMLTDDSTGDGTTIASASDLRPQDLDGWDIIITDDSTPYGRPDPITGEVPPFGVLRAMLAPSVANPGSDLWASFQSNPTTRPAMPTFSPATQFNPVTFNPGVNYVPAMTAGGPAANGYFVVGSPPASQDSGANGSPVQPVQWTSGINPVKAAIGTTGASITLPTLTGANQSMFLWAYLRRPANPFDQKAYGQSEMVVVDSIRFPYTVSNGTGSTNPGPPAKDKAVPGTTTLYSSHRRQPYRGGQVVPPIQGTGAGSTPLYPNPANAYGYSEQTGPVYGAATAQANIAWGSSATDQAAANRYLDSLQSSFGASNGATDDNPWDYFAFHDRDFMSPAELLMVPGCPPGLFTKQFVESNSINATPTPPYPLGPVTPGAGIPTITAANQPSNTGTIRNFAERYATNAGATPPALLAHTYPYLNDEFFYTGASIEPSPNAPNAGLAYPIKVGGPTGDGWYKMFEVVEVPSSANGAIGPVASGADFDWARQDLKPGLLNLNLIVDEEVFFGLVDDGRLNIDLASRTSSLPKVVTQINANGYPSYSGLNANNLPIYVGAYPMSDVTSSLGLVGRGYTYTDATGTEVTGLKAAFSDFLKLRHGGSGFLFGYGSGTTGSGPAINFLGTAPTTSGTNTIATPMAAERPFRSFSYPDINYTVLRPASLPPSNLTFPAATVTPPFQFEYYYPNTGATMTSAEYGSYLTLKSANTTVLYPDQTLVWSPTQAAPYVGDPGVRNPFLTLPLPSTAVMSGRPGVPFNPRGAPLVPPRRLFGIPDTSDGVGASPVSGNAEFPQVTDSTNTFYLYRNLPNQPALSEQLSQPKVTTNYVNQGGTTPGTASALGTANLFTLSRNIIPAGAPPYPTTLPTPVNQYLGAGFQGTSVADYRQHPYYRTEMLQKVMNQSTVRTHQFACWITVGFFEVLSTGSPALGVPDILGAEMGLLAGKNVRYRGFFLLDRTKAVGFNAHTPGDFHALVTYRRRIE